MPLLWNAHPVNVSCGKFLSGTIWYNPALPVANYCFVCIIVNDFTDHDNNFHISFPVNRISGRCLRIMYLQSQNSAYGNLSRKPCLVRLHYHECIRGCRKMTVPRYSLFMKLLTIFRLKISFSDNPLLTERSLTIQTRKNTQYPECCLWQKQWAGYFTSSLCSHTVTIELLC